MGTLCEQFTTMEVHSPKGLRGKGKGGEIACLGEFLAETPLGIAVVIDPRYQIILWRMAQ